MYFHLDILHREKHAGSTLTLVAAHTLYKEKKKVTVHFCLSLTLSITEFHKEALWNSFLMLSG